MGVPATWGGGVVTLEQPGTFDDRNAVMGTATPRDQLAASLS